MQYVAGLGIVLGIGSGVLPSALGIGMLPSTSTGAPADTLALLQSASLIWAGILGLAVAVIGTGLFRIARIPS